jgi:hypothetical protein
VLEASIVVPSARPVKPTERPFHRLGPDGLARVDDLIEPESRRRIEQSLQVVIANKAAPLANNCRLNFTHRRADAARG